MWQVYRPVIFLIVLMLLMVFFAGLGAACSLTPSTPTPPSTPQVTLPAPQGNTPMPETCPATILLDESSSGNIVNIHKGDVIGITLKTNPSTGYDWQVEKADPAHLLQGENAYSGFNQEKVGSSGQITLCFTAHSVGESHIELTYRRAWQKPSSTNPTWAVTLIINE